MSAAIVLDQVRKGFGAKVVIQSLSLAIPAGSVFALLGENSAGKSTTIRMLAGLLPPTSGRCEVLGLDAWRHSDQLRPRLGYVPEKPKFYDWMSVGELGWFTAGFHAAGYWTRYQDLVRRFGLDLNVKLRHLSKGQYAKAALAVALAQDPEVLLLDEPTSGLDLFIRREFLSSMVDLAGEGKTILIASHQIAEVERVASHVGFLAGGQLVLTCPMEELKQRLVRLRLRYEQVPPDVGTLGEILRVQDQPPFWEAIIFNPIQPALDALHGREDVLGVETAALSLEESYTVLLDRKEGR